MPQLRKDPVIGRWVIIATERGKRPHDFSKSYSAPPEKDCPFCEGKEIWKNTMQIYQKISF